MKPLGIPPYALKWRHLRDGAWELRSTTKSTSFLGQQDEDRKKEEGGNLEDGEDEEQKDEEEDTHKRKVTAAVLKVSLWQIFF